MAQNNASSDPYLETRVKHISDEDLFASLKPSIAELREVRAAANHRDWAAAYTAWRAYLKTRLGQPSSDLGGESAREKFDEQEVLAEADLVVQRDIKCWGGIRIQYAGEVDFARNLGGASNYGFHYFGWITPLKHAYRLTGEEKYAQTFVDIFTQWRRQRDLARGDIQNLDVIWNELGCKRARAFCDLYFATIHAKAAHHVDYHRMMLKTILGHGRWLHRHQQAYRAGNWQVYGAQTLCALGRSFPEFKEASRWLKRGVKWIVAHTQRDVYADGCHKERAPHYHLGVVKSSYDVYRVLIGVDAVATQREKLGQALETMLLWTLSISTPSGHSPAIGDSEYDAPQNHYLQIGLARRNPHLVWAAQALGLNTPVSACPPTYASINQQPSGFWIVRSGWGPEDFYFAINYGPHGGGHSHREALAFQLWAHGRPLAVDCGRGVSYDDPLHKPWYCSTDAHNMISVDHQAPGRKGGKGRLRFWRQQGPIDFAAFTHNGYQSLGVAHRRCLLLNRERQYAIVFDFLTSAANHIYHWLLNSPLALRAQEDGAAAPGFRVLCADSPTLSDIQISTVKMALPIEGRSTWGVEREDGSHLQLTRLGQSIEFAVLLASTDSPGDVQLEVQNTHSKSRYQRTVHITIDQQQDRYLLDCRTGALLVQK